MKKFFQEFKKFITRGNVIDMMAVGVIIGGASITAVINFFLIALVLFIIIKAMMGAKGFLNKQTSKLPTREERKEWKTQGVNMKNRAEVLKATEELRESKKTEPAPAKPTQEKLLANILDELKKQNSKAKAND